jgi:redox-sensitive bicupin YhaK (pirin superfamily)
MMHRDSLGSIQEIKPGYINWMTTGKGIVHSERTGINERGHNHRIHGIQTWVALPKETWIRNH